LAGGSVSVRFEVGLHRLDLSWLCLAAPGHEFIGTRSLYASQTAGGIDCVAVCFDLQAASRQENMSARPIASDVARFIVIDHGYVMLQGIDHFAIIGKSHLWSWVYCPECH
jgi:hypothetical protein